jgi:hypothetical protein
MIHRPPLLTALLHPLNLSMLALTVAACLRSAWSAPVSLGPNVISDANETWPSLSWDAKMLLFGTTRPGVEGMYDIFYSIRE